MFINSSTFKSKLFTVSTVLLNFNTTTNINNQQLNFVSATNQLSQRYNEYLEIIKEQEQKVDFHKTQFRNMIQLKHNKLNEDSIDLIAKEYGNKSNQRVEFQNPFFKTTQENAFEKYIASLDQKFNNEFAEIYRTNLFQEDYQQKHNDEENNNPYYIGKLNKQQAEKYKKLQLQKLKEIQDEKLNEINNIINQIVYEELDQFRIIKDPTHTNPLHIIIELFDKDQNFLQNGFFKLFLDAAGFPQAENCDLQLEYFKPFGEDTFVNYLNFFQSKLTGQNAILPNLNDFPKLINSSQRLNQIYKQNINQQPFDINDIKTYVSGTFPTDLHEQMEQFINHCNNQYVKNRTDEQNKEFKNNQSGRRAKMGENIAHGTTLTLNPANYGLSLCVFSPPRVVFVNQYYKLTSVQKTFIKNLLLRQYQTQSQRCYLQLSGTQEQSQDDSCMSMQIVQNPYNATTIEPWYMSIYTGSRFLNHKFLNSNRTVAKVPLNAKDYIMKGSNCQTFAMDFLGDTLYQGILSHNKWTQAFQDFILLNNRRLNTNYLTPIDMILKQQENNQVEYAIRQNIKGYKIE